MRKARLTRQEKMLSAIPVILVAFLLRGYGNRLNDILWAIHPRGDKLEKTARQLSRWGATDCGRVASGDAGGATTQADACTVAAFKAHKPFRVRYDEWGIDSVVYEGIVGTPDGKIYFLHYGSAIIYPASALSQTLCQKPVIVITNGHERIQCQ